MNSPADDIKDILEAAVSSWSFGTNLFVALEPPSPNEVVSVFDTGGFDPDSNTDLENPTVMVRVRGDRGGYTETYSRARDVKDNLHELANETWNGTRYIGIWQVGDILFIGMDENDRPVFTLNFRIMRT